MTDDHNLPEDDSLPQWLQGHIFDEPEEDDRSLEELSADSSVFAMDASDDVPSGAGMDTPAPKEGSEEGTEDKPPTRPLKGMTGALPWLAGADEEDAPPAPRKTGKLRGLTGKLPWLSEQPGSDSPSEEESPPSDPFTDSGDIDSSPDWLPKPEAEKEPSWLPQESAEAEPDFMSDIGGAAPVRPAERPVEKELPAVGPEWMADTGDFTEEPAAQHEDAAPEWLSAATDDLPEQQAVEGSTGEAAPAWLSTVSDEEAAPTPVEEVEEKAPDWLASAGDLVDEVEEESEPLTEELNADAQPAWVTDADEEEDEPVPAPDSGLTFDEWVSQGKEDVQEPSQEEVLAAEVPDWFGDISDAGEAASEADAETGPDLVPEWYMGLEENKSTDAPDWLNEAVGSTPHLPSEPVFEVPESGPEIPAEAAAEPAAPVEPAAVEDAEVPDWFGGIEGEAPAPPSAPPVDEEGADWLDDIQSEGMPDIEQAAFDALTVESMMAESGDFMSVIDDELSEAEMAASLAAPDDKLLMALDSDPAADLDSIMAEADLPHMSAFAEEAPPAVPATPDDMVSANLPDWLAREKDRPRPPVGFSAVDTALRSEEAPLDALEPRLRDLRERTELGGVHSDADAAELGVPPTDILSGVSGALTPARLIEESGGRAIALEASIESAQENRVATLVSLLGIDAMHAAKDEAGDAPVRIDEAGRRARTRSRYKPERVVVTLLLLAAILSPFFVDLSAIIELPPPVMDVEQFGTIHSMIESLEPGALVLVGFEYGPTAAGELDALAETLLTHILLQGARPVVASTNPAGVLHGRDVLEVMGRDAFILAQLERSGRPLVTPDDYVVLSYLPGGAVGLRAMTATSTDVNAINTGVFAVDLEGNGTGLDISLMQMSFDFVLTFAERGEDLRMWVEQVGAAVNLPMAAAVTVATEPLARPYLQSGQLIGLLAGYRDAYLYDKALLGTIVPEIEATATAMELAFLPTPTPAVRQPTASPTDEATVAPTETLLPTESLRPSDATATANALATLAGTPALDATATPRQFITATPASDDGAAVQPAETTLVPTEEAQAAADGPALPQRPFQDERWYSMTMGALAASGLIGLGAFVNIFRGIRRRRDQ